jgi:hypothetical protein
MKKLLVVTVVLALLVSCGDGGGGGGVVDGGGGGGGGGGDLTVTKTFYAQRGDTAKFYQLQAERLAQNARCEIWVQRNSGVTAAQAQKIASEYSNNIYPKMISTFSENIDASSVQPGLVFNTIEFAHWLITGARSGGKLTILLLDIQDGYKKGENEAFVAGYFTALDFFENDDPDYPSNERAMLYIDVNPLPVESELFYSTIAHEMQHLMNFATTVLQRSEVSNGVITAINLMDTWINEGLSSAAEYIYLNKHLQHRIDDFSNDSTGLIAKGNNFFVWGNRDSEDPNAVLDDYATVYLFFQWLRLQKGGTNIYKNIIFSEQSDYKAIDSNDWSTTLGAWLRANYDRSTSGEYGYKNDTALNQIERHYTPQGATTISLYPGEGVYSYVNSSSTVNANSGNIIYMGLGDVSGSTINSGGALLTYNKNTTVYVYDNNGNVSSGPVSESGTITGNSPPNANIIAGRSVLSGVRSGPFPISAEDMLRRRGRDYVYERNFTGVNNRLLNQRLLTGAVIE